MRETSDSTEFPLPKALFEEGMRETLVPRSDSPPSSVEGEADPPKADDAPKADDSGLRPSHAGPPSTRDPAPLQLLLLLLLLLRRFASGLRLSEGGVWFRGGGRSGARFLGFIGCSPDADDMMEVWSVVLLVEGPFIAKLLVDGRALRGTRTHCKNENVMFPAGYSLLSMEVMKKRNKTSPGTGE